jgi:hypothetical protein
MGYKKEQIATEGVQIRPLMVAVAYVAAQMLADITSLRIISIAGLSMDAGTLVYPITFTLRDLVHKALGITHARALIVAAAVINLFMAGLFWLVGILPPDPLVGPQAEFGQVLSPVWNITVASIVAEVVSEMTDTEVYRFWVQRVTRRYQWARVLVSNGVSIPLDSLIFSWLAFGRQFPATVVWGIFMANVLIKGLTTLLSLPLIYVVKEEG